MKKSTIKPLNQNALCWLTALLFCTVSGSNYGSETSADPDFNPDVEPKPGDLLGRYRLFYSYQVRRQLDLDAENKRDIRSGRSLSGVSELPGRQKIKQTSPSVSESLHFQGFFRSLESVSTKVWINGELWVAEDGHQTVDQKIDQTRKMRRLLRIKQSALAHRVRDYRLLWSPDRKIVVVECRDGRQTEVALGAQIVTTCRQNETIVPVGFNNVY